MKKTIYLLLISFLSEIVFAESVNVYTSRHYDSDDTLYEEFTDETGIKINIISGKTLRFIWIKYIALSYDKLSFFS